MPNEDTNLEPEAAPHDPSSAGAAMPAGISVAMRSASAPKRSRRRVMIVSVATVLVSVVIGIYLFGPWSPAANRAGGSDHASHPAPGSEDSAAAHTNRLHLTPRDRFVADVRTVRIDYRTMTTKLNLSGGVDFDERSHKVVTARYGGRIERLFVDQTGRFVRRGAPLMEIYSPELITAQKEYLLAREATSSSLLAGTVADTAYRRRTEIRDRGLTDVARKRLVLFGMSDAQIAALEQRGEIAYSITVYSPIAGTVITRGVTEGAYVNEGTLLIDLVDLSTVWVMVNVYETDAYRIQRGMAVTVGGPSLGGAVLHGAVEYVYPTVDAASRTVKVRVPLANPGNILRPGMYVSATIDLPARDMLAVPVDAVVRTGKRDLVYVEVDAGMFESREVVLGLRGGDYYQVADGPIHAGDMVVANGGYLLDSETRLSSSTSDPHAGMNMGGKEKK